MVLIQIKLFKEHIHVRRQFRPKQGLYYMIRPKIFDRFIRVARERRGPKQELVFRRNIDTEFFSVANHVEDILSDDRGLPDYAHRRRALGQNESGYVMV